MIKLHEDKCLYFKYQWLLKVDENGIIKCKILASQYVHRISVFTNHCKSVQNVGMVQKVMI